MSRRRRRLLAAYVGAAIVVGLGIHFAYPALAGLQRSVDLLGRANVWWIAAAAGFSALSLGCYVAVFRIVGGGPERLFGWRESYEIAMASQAASTVITAGGAGGIALLFWALTRAGLERAQAASRIVAFLAFHYSIYLVALVMFGTLLWLGVLPGNGPASLMILPAALAAVALALLAVAATRPAGVQRRLTGRSTGEGRLARLAHGLLDAPAALSSGLRYARTLLQGRSQAATLVALALGYWTANIAVLWACFEAFGSAPALAGLVLAYFVGMTANLLPLLPGGVGSVEAGLIATLLAFGEPGAEVVVAVLTYRLIAFWLPTIPEAVAYFQLRRTVAGWGEP